MSRSGSAGEPGRHVYAPVIVCGTGRSGTSTVARILHEELGVRMAASPELLTGPHFANPRGTYQDREISGLQMGYLGLHPGLHPGVRPWQGRARTLGQLRREMERAAASRNRVPWGWKDPLTAHLLHLYVGWFPGARLVWCRRDPEAAADSFRRHAGISPDKARALVLAAYHRLEYVLAMVPHLALDFDQRRSDKWVRDRLEPCRAATVGRDSGRTPGSAGEAV